MFPSQLEAVGAHFPCKNKKKEVERFVMHAWATNIEVIQCLHANIHISVCTYASACTCVCVCVCVCGRGEGLVYALGNMFCQLCSSKLQIGESISLRAGWLNYWNRKTLPLLFPSLPTFHPSYSTPLPPSGVPSQHLNSAILSINRNESGIVLSTWLQRLLPV